MSEISELISDSDRKLAIRFNAFKKYASALAAGVSSDSESDSDSDELMEATLKIIAATIKLINKRKKRKRLLKSLIKHGNEITSFHFVNTHIKLDKFAYNNYVCMDVLVFKKLLSYVEKDLQCQEQDTIMKDSISPAEKLSVTLRFLATGETYKNIADQTKLPVAFLSKNIPLVCESLWNNLKNEYAKFPSSKAEWLQIAEKFAIKLQFPHCLGALDIKHISFKGPGKDGFCFYNYKGTQSIIILAIADADCKFKFLEIGCNGGIEDSEALIFSKFQEVLYEADKYFPPKREIGKNRLLPYVIVTDNGYPLANNILKPYIMTTTTTTDKQQQIFNNRLCRARQSVERAFQILCTRFKILQKTIPLHVDKVTNIAMACCVLHNFLLNHNFKNYTNIQQSSSNHCERHDACEYYDDSDDPDYVEAEKIRTSFAEYFVNEGKVCEDENI